MRFQPIRAAGLGRLALFGLALLALAACTETGGGIPKAQKPVPPILVGKMSELGMKDTAPIFVRIFKESSELEVWKQTRAGTYALLTTYSICKWSGALGPKKVEGDRQAPEGFYTVTPAQMNPNSSYYLSFNIGYPNAYDRSLGRTGSNLMVHGACSSAGCYSMTDDNAGEIFALARDAFRGGQRNFQIQALPFRMTPENMARHRNDPNMPFWRMLKVGYDTFEITRVPPKVDVCGRHYVFNADAGGASFDASAPCPAYSVPADLMAALQKREAADDQAMASASAALDAEAQRAAEEQARADAAAAAAKAREAERATEPSLVSRVLSAVAPGNQNAPDATTTGSTDVTASTPPERSSFVSKLLAKVGIGGGDKADAPAAPPAKTTRVAKVPPPVVAPDTVRVVPKPRVRPEDGAPDSASASAAPDAAPAISPDMTPDIPKVGRFVKKKFLWDEETGDGSDTAGSGASADQPAL